MSEPTKLVEDGIEHMSDAKTNRVIACVNACYGIENPAAIKDVIEAARKALDELLAVSNALEIEHLEVVYTYLENLKTRLRTDLAALKVKP